MLDCQTSLILIERIRSPEIGDDYDGFKQVLWHTNKIFDRVQMFSTDISDMVRSTFPPIALPTPRLW